MARRNLPIQPIQPVRTVHYIDPAMQSDLIRHGLMNPAEMVRQQQRNTELYLRWKARQAEIKERDKKFRRFWLGFGALVGLVFLAGLFVGGWLLWTVMGLGALAVPVVLLLACGLAVGGHRCITIVQHMH
ncbi:hypothetical protein Asp14428_27280 [Actinoplanes sp. NBRC 14428]|nr:hypothetical protein Asp14428_27280 [Actinoplanes sp. NBRC 14428]